MTNRDQAIEDKFNKYQDSLVLQQADLSLKSIADMVESGAIDINPKYQRRERWTAKKESDLIESFILNIPVPPIYLAEDAYGTYSVIDGKQRITAISNFLNKKIKLSELERFKEIEGYSFDELPSNIKNALSIRPYLRVVTLLKQSNSDLKHEVFLRLNKAGVPLNSQEIRNVAFRGGMNDLLMELSQNPSFVEVMNSEKGTKTYKEMIDVQFVLRFFTVKETWMSFPGNMDIAMDSFMKKNYLSSEQELSQFKMIFEKSLNACLEIWGEETFKKPNSNKRVLQGFYDIEMVCLSLLEDDELQRVLDNKETIKSLLENEIENNELFSKAVTQFTSNPKNVLYRIETFLNILKSV